MQIIGFSIFSIIFGLFNAWQVLKIDLDKQDAEDIDDELNVQPISTEKISLMKELAQLIQEGSDTFLSTEFKAIGVFIVLFSIIIALVVETNPGEFYFTGAFLLGSLTSLLSGYIGMWISVRANVRTTKVANTSLAKAFVVAFKGGAVLGFVLVGLGLVNLVLLIMLYKYKFTMQVTSSYMQMF